MILTSADRRCLPARFSLVDGCFDPIHRGHIAYFTGAAALGLPVLCNLAADSYITGHKLRSPLLPENDRAEVIDALRCIDFTFLSRHGTAWSLRQLRPAYYVKGIDWKDRLPEEQVAICRELGIEIKYVNCPLDSSSRILEAFLENQYAHKAV